MAEIDVAALLEQAGVRLPGLPTLTGGAGLLTNDVAAGGEPQVVVATADERVESQARVIPLVMSADQGPSEAGPEEALVRIPLMADVNAFRAPPGGVEPVLIDVGMADGSALAADTWQGLDIRAQTGGMRGLDQFGALEIMGARGGLR